jgi:hypothetical protein
MVIRPRNNFRCEPVLWRIRSRMAAMWLWRFAEADLSHLLKDAPRPGRTPTIPASVTVTVIQYLHQAPRHLKRSRVPVRCQEADHPVVPKMNTIGSFVDENGHRSIGARFQNMIRLAIFFIMSVFPMTRRTILDA